MKCCVVGVLLLMLLKLGKVKTKTMLWMCGWVCQLQDWVISLLVVLPYVWFFKNIKIVYTFGILNGGFWHVNEHFPSQRHTHLYLSRPFIIMCTVTVIYCTVNIIVISWCITLCHLMNFLLLYIMLLSVLLSLCDCVFCGCACWNTAHSSMTPNLCVWMVEYTRTCEAHIIISTPLK